MSAMQQPLPSNQEQCTILIQQLHEGVTQELLYKEFKKFGTIKSLKYYAKTKSANLVFSSSAEANEAKRSLNHSNLLKKEINIVTYQSKEDLLKKKKFNLFLRNVPEDLETKKLADFLSKYGEIVSLMLKKNDENKNLGYGYVQFETKEAYDKILEEHNQFTKINITNTNDSFNVQQFNDSNKTKINKFHINGFYQHAVPQDQVEEKTKEIEEVLKKAKEQFNQIQYHIAYNESKANFWANIEFTYTDEKQEDEISIAIKKLLDSHFSFNKSVIQINNLLGREVPPTEATLKTEIDATLQTIKEQLGLLEVSSLYSKIKKDFRVKLEFSYEANKKEETIAKIEKVLKEKYPQSSQAIIKPTKGPQNNFKANESSERYLFLKGVNHSVNEQDIADWVEECINVEVDPSNIKITKNNSVESTYNASIFFEEKEHGTKLMIFCAKIQNKDKNDLILLPRHKVTLFLKKIDQEQLKNLKSKVSIYTGNSNANIQMSTQVEKPQMLPFFFPPPNFVGKQFAPSYINNPTIPNNLPKKHTQIPDRKAPVPPPVQQSIFMKFYQLNTEDKRSKIDEIVQAIQTQQAEFFSLKEEIQRSILGQIIYYIISNLDVDADEKLHDYLNEVSQVENKQQAKAKIEEFKSQVGKITGMLIDQEVFTILDIIEIVKDKRELIERCKEAIDLITQKN